MSDFSSTTFLLVYFFCLIASILSPNSPFSLMSLFHYLLSIISLLSSVISLAVSPGFHQDVFFLSGSLPRRPLFSPLTMFFFSSLSYSLTFLSQRLLLSLSESLYHHWLCLPPRSSHTLTCAHLYTQSLIHIPPVSVSLELSEGIKSTFKIHLFILSYSLSDSRSYSFLYSSPMPRLPCE